MKKIICPTCKQDMNDLPHEGLNDENCEQCGQGWSWKEAAKLKNRLHSVCTEKDNEINNKTS